MAFKQKDLLSLRNVEREEIETILSTAAAMRPPRAFRLPICGDTSCILLTPVSAPGPRSATTSATA